MYRILFPLVLIAGLVGCDDRPQPEPEPVDPVQSSIQHHKHISDQAAVSLVDYEKARAFPPHAIVFNEASDHAPTPGPTPEPTPTPGGKCDKCNGTGVFRPDGTIDRPCPKCGGDGVTSLPDLEKYIASLEKPVHAPVEDLEAFRLGLTREQVQDAKNMGWTLERYAALEKRISQLESGSAKLKQSIDTTDQIFHDLREDAEVQEMNIKWLKEPEEGWKESLRTGKPALIYWTGMNCAPCRRMESQVITKPQVARYLANNFVCIKVDVESFPIERIKKYGIKEMPSFSIIPPSWKNVRTLKKSFDPEVFVSRLRGGEQWTKVSLTKTASSRSVRMRYANLQQDDLSAEGTPIESDWAEPIPKTEGTLSMPEKKSAVEPVQYYVMSGSGSNGGRSIGYSAPMYYSAPAYYSSGPSYGSAGGGGGYSRSYYSSPSYGYSGWGGGGWGGYYGGGGGGSMVCGPGGCYITY